MQTIEALDRNPNIAPCRKIDLPKFQDLMNQFAIQFFSKFSLIPPQPFINNRPIVDPSGTLFPPVNQEISEITKKILFKMNELTHKNHKLSPENIDLMLRLVQSQGVSQANPNSPVRFSKKRDKNTSEVLTALAKFGHPEGLARTVILPPQEKPTHFEDLTWYAVATSCRIAKDQKPTGGYKRIRFAVDHTGSPVAIAAIRIKKEKRSNHLQEIEREIKLMERMNRAGALHVVQLKNHWLDRLSDKYYIVMEACNGRDLFDRLNSQQQFSLEEKLIVFKHFILGLKEMAEEGIAHYDVKPENIITISDPKRKIIGAKILDLGLAGDPTQWNGRGTKAYWSPEQRTCYAEASKDEQQNLWKSFGGNQFPHDVFSSGIVALNLFANDATETFDWNPFTQQHQIAPQPSLIKRVEKLKDSQCPREIKTLISEMLSRSYKERPTLDQIWERLKKIDAPLASTENDSTGRVL